jgi:hypothetical protein
MENINRDKVQHPSDNWNFGDKVRTNKSIYRKFIYGTLFAKQKDYAVIEHPPTHWIKDEKDRSSIIHTTVRYSTLELVTNDQEYKAGIKANTYQSPCDDMIKWDFLMRVNQYIVIACTEMLVYDPDSNWILSLDGDPYAVKLENLEHPMYNVYFNPININTFSIGVLYKTHYDGHNRNFKPMVNDRVYQAGKIKFTEDDDNDDIKTTGIFSKTNVQRNNDIPPAEMNTRLPAGQKFEEAEAIVTGNEIVNNKKRKSEFRIKNLTQTQFDSLYDISLKLKEDGIIANSKRNVVPIEIVDFAKKVGASNTSIQRVVNFNLGIINSTNISSLFVYLSVPAFQLRPESNYIRSLIKVSVKNYVNDQKNFIEFMEKIYLPTRDFKKAFDIMFKDTDGGKFIEAIINQYNDFKNAERTIALTNAGEEALLVAGGKK